MRTFAASCLAATSLAVRIQLGGDQLTATPTAANVVILGNLQAHVDEKIADGEICLACGDDFKLPVEYDNVNVASPEEQIAAVIAQIESGFEAIADYNTNVEVVQVEEYQADQQELIEEIMESAEDEAAEIISEESDASEAAEEIEEVMEDAAEDIIEINQTHDVAVADAAKTAFVAEITNEAIKDTIVNDIATAIGAGAGLDEALAEQHLPFDVQTPAIGDVVEKIPTVEQVKNDPKFDSFLANVLANFSGLVDAPANAQADFYFTEGDYRPDSPTAATRPDFAEDGFYYSEAEYRPSSPDAPSRPNKTPRHLDDQPEGRTSFRGEFVPEFQVDRFNRSEAEFNPNFSYESEYAGNGGIEVGIEAERQQVRDATRFERFAVPQYEHTFDQRSTGPAEHAQY